MNATTPLLLLAAAASLALGAVPAPAERDFQVGAVEAGSAAPQRFAVGTIVGRVEIGAPAGRRAVDRYQGRGAPRSAHPIQSVPAVVFLEGPVPGAARESAVTRTLLQQDTTFVPAAVAIPVGGTVEFPNGDPFFHNVFSYSDVKRFDLGRYPEGESKSVVFDRAGIVQVFCEVHEHMRGAIVVTENPYHAVVGEDGTFQIPDIPAGRHTLVVWHQEAGRRTVTVNVTDGGTVEIPTVTLP